MKKILTVILAVMLMLTMVQAALAESYPEFNFETRTVTLNSGYEMPMLGLGMFSLSDSQAENSTYWALKAGFRLIDTARTGAPLAIVEAIDYQDFSVSKEATLRLANAAKEAGLLVIVAGCIIGDLCIIGRRF